MNKLFVTLLCFFTSLVLSAQPVTGVWRGKISTGKGVFAKSCKVELKLVKNGDSLTGSAYYFMNASNYIRYSVKGYLDNRDYSVHWQDDKLLDIKPAGSKTMMMFESSMKSDASFNCPNPAVMKLDGVSHIGKDGPELVLQFDKIEKTLFPDEWDNVIEGYFAGMAEPGIIDSVRAIAKEYKPVLPEAAIAQTDGRDRKKDNSTKDGVTKKADDQTETIPVIATSTSITNEQPEVIPVATFNDKKEQPAVEHATSPKEASTPATVSLGAPPPVTNTQSSTKPAATAQTTSQVTTPVSKPKPELPAPVVAKNTPPVTPSKPHVVKQETPPRTTVAVTPPPVAKPVTKPAGNPKPVVKPPVTINEPLPGSTVKATPPKTTVTEPKTVAVTADPLAVEKFTTRKKVNQAELPIVGDSIELSFYDNAEVDGDSISLFLNGRLLFNHVRLTTQAYTFKIATKDLASGSELAMVAENLGSIPPNTAYMMAIVDGERYSARLESTEQTSGVIKLVRR